jgi:hypothetical protein
LNIILGEIPKILAACRCVKPSISLTFDIISSLFDFGKLLIWAISVAEKILLISALAWSSVNGSKRTAPVLPGDFADGAKFGRACFQADATLAAFALFNHMRRFFLAFYCLDRALLPASPAGFAFIGVDPVGN